MKKKDYILKLLDSLNSSRPLAEWLIKLIEENAVDDNSIDALISIFSTAMDSITDSSNKAKIQHWMKVLKKIKTMEAAEHTQESKDLQDMLDELD